MKHRFALLLALLLLLAAPAAAQRIEMEEIYLAFDYPDDWLVVSPQLALVYAPLLEAAGIDPVALSEEMLEQGVASRAYSPDFTESLSIITASDSLSGEIFQMEDVTDAQRRSLRTKVENNTLYETTGLRTQDDAWQKEGGIYWLYVHYTKTRGDQTVGRGLRYVTVYNGMYVMLDWQVENRRFGNKDLSAFRARLADITVTERITEPVRSVTLTAQIPSETSSSPLTITGVTEPNAVLVAEAPDREGQMQTLSVGSAGSSGSFSLLVPLEDEGTYAITLTASAEGMNEASVSGEVTYNAKMLPVSLMGVPEDGVVTSDKTIVSGQTLAGVQMQLVTPFGLTKKTAGNDGTFSFELTTNEAGSYDYTLICTKSGYNERRVFFTLIREITDEQERDKIRQSAVKISYKNLQAVREADQGQVMSIYGPVTEVSTSGDICYVRMQFNKDANGWYNDIIVVAEEDLGVRVGDMLTVVATVDGVFVEQDASGADVSIPRFDLLFVDKVE